MHLEVKLPVALFSLSFMWRTNPQRRNIEKGPISAFWPALKGGVEAAYELEDEDILFLFKGKYSEA